MGRPSSARLVALLAALGLASGALALATNALRTGDTAWWEELPAGDPPRLLAGESLRKLRLGQEIRNAALAPAGGALTLRIEPRAGDVLELAAGLACPGAGPCRGLTRFRATAGDSVLLERVLDPGTDAWSVARVDLSPLAGRATEIRLAASPDGSLLQRARGPAALPVWGEPLLARVGGKPPPVGSAAPARPHVLLISIDTLRADRLGAYGYGRPTTPSLDALAAEGVRFDDAISQAPWTTPSHMSLLTSLYPSSHGLVQSFARLRARKHAPGSYPVLDAGVPTLAALLRDAGWRSLALTGGSTLDGQLGFARGFDVYRERSARLDETVAAELADWLDTFAAREPTFLFFHTFEVHAAYTHPEFARALLPPDDVRKLDAFLADAPARGVLRAMEEFLRREGLLRREVTSALYDGGIRYTDAFLGRLFDELRRRGLWDRTVVVVTSDHGEEFGDHHRGRVYDAHCLSLYDELVRVPLLFRVPGRFDRGNVVDATVELVDVAPTLLELLELPRPEGLQGSSLVPLLAGEAPAEGGFALSEGICRGPEWKALRSDDTKYIAGYGLEADDRRGIPGPLLWEQLYDLDADPDERHDRAAEDPETRDALRRALEERLEHLPRGGAASRAVDGGTVERLRALGYVDE